MGRLHRFCSFALGRGLSLFVSDGILFANSSKKYAKNAARNRWFLDFLCRVQELWSKSRRSRESTSFYSRCRYIGWLKGCAVLSLGTDCHSQCEHWLSPSCQPVSSRLHGVKTGTLPRNHLASSATGGASVVSAMTRQESRRYLGPL